MFQRIILLLFLQLSGCPFLSAQMQPDDIPDQHLADFIKAETIYPETGPLPDGTTYGNRKMSFPWLYMDKRGWDNLADKLVDPYFKDIYDRNIKAIKIYLAHDKELVRGMDMETLIPARTHVRTLKRWVERTTVAWYITLSSCTPAGRTMAI
ncbi:MAG TPA: hypothetical protein VE870_04295 [Bacteroidales bacterium]|nr:hypothetical protein [Bacteroidales bacterium]